MTSRAEIDLEVADGSMSFAVGTRLVMLRAGESIRVRGTVDEVRALRDRLQPFAEHGRLRITRTMMRFDPQR